MKKSFRVTPPKNPTGKTTLHQKPLILLDTNPFLLPGKFKVDVFEQIREEFGKPKLYTLDLVVKELKKISKGRSSNSRYAKLGLELLKRNKVEIIRSKEKTADREIERIGKTYIIFTQDRNLIRKLKAKSISVISLRQGKYLKKV